MQYNIFKFISIDFQLFKLKSYVGNKFIMRVFGSLENVAYV